MRRSREIMILIALLAGAMVFVLGYVIHRRAGLRTTVTAPQSAIPSSPAVAGPRPVPFLGRGPVASPGNGTAPVPLPVPPGSSPGPVLRKPVELGGENENRTIDFSSGEPVMKDSPEDRVAIESALKEIRKATKDVTFEPTRNGTDPAPSASGK